MHTDDVLKVFGQVIKEKRSKLNISQEQLAELCDAHRTYISMLERGLKSISIKVLFPLAAGLNTTPSKLLEDVEEKLKR